MNYVYGLKQIIDQYDALIIDIWGVLHNGVTPYPGVIECLKHLREIKKPFILLSNAPRPGKVAAEALHTMGLQIEADHIVTSGDVVRYQLQHHEDAVFSTFGRAFYHVGAGSNVHLLAGLDLESVDSIDDADYILLTLFIEAHEPLDQCDILFQQAINRNLPLICTNPDKVAMHGDSLRYCAGTFAQRYEFLGGKTYYYGKPYPAVYQWVFDKLKNLNVTESQRILAVGDALATDIAGATALGIDSALIMTGVHQAQVILDRQGLPADQTSFTEMCQAQGQVPTWVLPGFIW